MKSSTKIRIVTIIGARPQIIKSAAISREIMMGYSQEIEEIVVHTGQHYDTEMSEVFFKELNIPTPKYNLEVGSGAHGTQTAKMIEGIETILLQEKPNYILLYGDTNSTVAGALSASKTQIPIVHIEAGLRSFDKKMPEEINRILTDHCSTFLFSPTQSGVDNLAKEGFDICNTKPYSINNPGVFMVGDIMYDNSLYFSKLAEEESTILRDNDLSKENYILITVHRNTNTDVPEKLKSIFDSLISLSKNHLYKLVLPIHPRTKQKMEQFFDEDFIEIINQTIKIIPPVSFLDMIELEKNSKLIITDSGGVQKEAYFFKKPSLILRPETEWVEIVESGNAIICDTDKSQIEEGVQYFLNKKTYNFPEFYGDGHAAKKILDILSENVD